MYWIKLYHEVLDDPKMAMLPDRLWRRVIELFLLAGKTGKTGYLPDARQIAWCLRLPIDEVEKDLTEIERLGIIRREENGWLVVNFISRQSPLRDADRKTMQREREKKEKYYGHGNVTEMSQNVTDTDNETAAVFRAYEQTIGLLTPAIVSKIETVLETVPHQWIIEALQISAEQNKRNWAYAAAILRRWKEQGKDNGAKPKTSAGMYLDPDGNPVED